MNKNIGNVEKYYRKKKITNVISWVAEILAAVILSVFFTFSFCHSIVVQEGSMEPTLHAGEKVLYDSVSYAVSSPKRGDIVVFSVGDDNNSSLHIKRIIGLPGETVQIQNGQVFINGEAIEESDSYSSITNAGTAEEAVTVGEDEYFVLGDNRNNSEDSRHVGVGMVQKSQIVGKLWFVISPSSAFGFIKK